MTYDGLLEKGAPAIRGGNKKLFSGFQLRWQALGQAEKVVCAVTVLIPLWWLLGIIIHLPLFLACGVIGYELFHHRKVRLKRPSLAVLLFVAFALWTDIEDYLLLMDLHPSIISPSGGVLPSPLSLLKSSFAYSIPFLLWYLQSHSIRIRVQVFAWACSILALEMTVGWLFYEFVLPGGCFAPPPRSVYGYLTGKAPVYINGFGPQNYLLFCESNGIVRFFFIHKQYGAAFLGFLSLFALELKNRYWSGALFVTSLILLYINTSRTVFLALPLAIASRFLLVFLRGKLAPLSLAIASFACFTFLSVYPVTYGLFEATNTSAEAIGGINQASTETRAYLYTETIKRIPNRLWFGHRLEERMALSEMKDDETGQIEIGRDYRIGTHSLILGDLLYHRGVVGTAIYLGFFIALVKDFYRTSPYLLPCWIPTLTLVVQMCVISPINFIMQLLVLLCFTLRRSSCSRTTAYASARLQKG